MGERAEAKPAAGAPLGRRGAAASGRARRVQEIQKKREDAPEGELGQRLTEIVEVVQPLANLVKMHGLLVAELPGSQRVACTGPAEREVIAAIKREGSGHADTCRGKREARGASDGPSSAAHARRPPSLSGPRQK